MPKKKRDHYETLGVGKDADGETIKKAHRRRAKETHPDRGGEKEEFEAVTTAFMVLGDPNRRRKYDQNGDDSTEPVDNVERRAYGLVSSTVAGILASLTPRQARKVDVVKKAREAIRQMLVKADEAIGKAQEAQADLRAVAGMFKEPDPGIIASMVNKEIATLDDFISERNGEKEVCEAAIRYLDGCRFNFDKQPAADPGFATAVWGFRTA